MSYKPLNLGLIGNPWNACICPLLDPQSNTAELSGIIVPIKIKKLLEAIQIEAMHIVTGAIKLCGIGKLYDDTGWETLEARRERQKLIIFFKMVHSLSPAYLNQLVLDLVQNQSHYSLRSSDNMSTIHTNSVLYYNSFLPSAVRSWNNLPNETRTSTSVTEFKHNLSEHRNKLFLLWKQSSPNSSRSFTP